MVNPEIDEYGNMYWRNSLGQYHREDGPAMVYVGGGYTWLLNDQVHREDGPAAEDDDGTKCWYINGLRHREDGPAVEYPDGDKRWYFNDIRYTEAEYKFIQFMKGIKVNG